MKRIVTPLILLFLALKVLAIDISEKQKAIIYNEAIKTLQNYELYSNQMADAIFDIEETNKISQRTIDLFVNRKAIIYNDLDPAHKLSEAYELETYINNLLLWYPDGMKFNFDYKNLKAGNLMEHGNNIFSLDIMITKNINGNYLNKQQNQNHEELLYRVAFFMENNGFENFKIAGVRSTSAKTNIDESSLYEVKSVTFSDKDMALIKDQSKALLNDYINFLYLLTDPNELTDDKVFYRISFFDLFKDTTNMVSNDIEPNPEKRWMQVPEYEKTLVVSYPDGIKNVGLNIDSAQYGKIISEGDNRFYVNGYINKYFSGKYQNKEIHRNNDKYDFKITFERDENTFKNFKLENIDKYGVDLYKNQNNNATTELPSLAITSLQRKGLYFGIAVGGGLTSLTNPNFTNQTDASWKIENKVNYSAALTAQYYLINQLCIKTGIGYNHYQSKIGIHGEFTSNQEFYTPVAGEPFYKTVTADFDSTVTYNYLTIPVTLIFHSNKDIEKWGIYAEAGVLASFKLNATGEASGSFETTGYFPGLPEGGQYLSDIADWGLTTYTATPGKQDIETPGFILSGVLSMGLTFPLGYYSTLYFGPEITLGLSDISTQDSYTDIYGNNLSAEKVKISGYGFKFGVNYKF